MRKDYPPYNVLDVADYVVRKCIKRRQPLSNFKLQQFLVQLHELSKTYINCGLFQTEMNTTSIGWRLPVVHERYKGWAGVDIFYNFDDKPIVLQEHDRLFIDEYLTRYIEKPELSAPSAACTSHAVQQPLSTSVCTMDELKACPQTTQADRIRAMSDEALAAFLFDIQKAIWNALCEQMGWKNSKVTDTTTEQTAFIGWLRQPVEE